MKEVDVFAGDRTQDHDSSWLQATLPPTFPADHIDIWRVRLDGWGSVGIEASVLFPDEIERASRFHFEKNRNYFARCRFALRVLLADYLAIPAAAIRFHYLSGGKPQVVAEQNPRTLHFNVSHSGNLALIAFCGQHRLGVDIERISSSIEAASLAEQFFSLRERAALRALPNHLRVAGFFACWTRKEAFLKAIGAGLSFPLSDFSVTAHPDHAPTLEEISGNTEAGKQWSLSDIRIDDNYRAAVAIESPWLRLQTYSFEDSVAKYWVTQCEGK